MKLSEYLKKNRITIKDFSKKVGVSDVQVGRILNGTRNPSLHLGKKIEEATNQEVSIGDLFNPEAPSRLKKRKKDE